MGKIEYQHKSLAAGRWSEMSLADQFGNIGSEVSRALRWKKKGNVKLMDGAINRALELYDLSLKANRNYPAALAELCRAREEFCDYFFAANSFHTDAFAMQRYYDQFAMLARAK